MSSYIKLHRANTQGPIAMDLLNLAKYSTTTYSGIRTQQVGTFMYDGGPL